MSHFWSPPHNPHHSSCLLHMQDAADGATKERRGADAEDEDDAAASDEAEEDKTSAEDASAEGAEGKADAETGDDAAEAKEGEAKEDEAKEGEADTGEEAAPDADADAKADAKADTKKANATESAAEAEARKKAEAEALKKAEEASKPRPVKITLDIASATKDLPDMDQDSVAAARERLQALLVRWAPHRAAPRAAAGGCLFSPSAIILQLNWLFFPRRV